MSNLPKLTPEQAAIHRHSTRIRPLDALRAMRLALRNPDDTEQAVRMIGALAGKSNERFMSRLLSTPHGREILDRERSLLEVLTNREKLMAMPEGSFGRIYVEWLEREQISAEGLVAASEAASKGEGEREGPYFVLGCRMREMHDLLHVVTGYGRDLVGEIGVLAFTYGQSKHSGLAFLLAVAYIRSLFGGGGPTAAGGREGRASMRKQLHEGYRRGRQAEWIVGADWEALLELPIDELRRRFRIPEPPAYLEVRSEGAPALAA